MHMLFIDVLSLLIFIVLNKKQEYALQLWWNRIS